MLLMILIVILALVWLPIIALLLIALAFGSPLLVVALLAAAGRGRTDDDPPTAADYTYSVAWSAVDDEYVGRVAEFPSLCWVGFTEDAALKGIHRAVEFVVKDMLASGERLPSPRRATAFTPC